MMMSWRPQANPTLAQPQEAKAPPTMIAGPKRKAAPIDQTLEPPGLPEEPAQQIALTAPWMQSILTRCRKSSDGDQKKDSRTQEHPPSDGTPWRLSDAGMIWIRVALLGADHDHKLLKANGIALAGLVIAAEV